MNATLMALAGQWPLLVGWTGYAILHSLLAATAVKQRILARSGLRANSYRLLYNLVAILALIPLVSWISLEPGPMLWRAPLPVSLLFDLLVGAALGVLVFAGPGYDLREFLGFRESGAPRLVVSGWHRYVRHPWYTVALLLIWTRPMSTAWLVSALFITAYFVFGSLLEERKLEGLFGDAYGRYRRCVPGLIPWRGPAISREEARRIEADAAAQVAAASASRH